ncbi:MAG: hypothetical protein ACOVQA_04225 [Thermoflexibacteraceae bacterium]|jgi:hypothetical protein
MKDKKVIFRKTTPEFSPSKRQFDDLLATHRKKMRQKMLLNIVILLVEVVFVVGVTVYAIYKTR